MKKQNKENKTEKRENKLYELMHYETGFLRKYYVFL